MSHSKLTIIANNRPRTLNEDEQISVEFSNPLFNDTEMFSYPIQLPLEGNHDLLKNVDDINSDIRPISLEHTPMRIIADGIPFASGPMVISEDEEIADSLGINVDSAVQDFQSMIGDITCRDIPIPEEDKPSLVIGEKIGNVVVGAEYDFYVIRRYKISGGHVDEKFTFQTHTVESTFEPQALGFSFPGRCVVKNESTQEAVPLKQKTFNDGTTVTIPQVAESYINVTDEYLGTKRANSTMGPAKFCNARVCYKHYDIKEDGTTSDKVVEVDKNNANKNPAPEDHGPFWVLEADRPQSGICFYVLYFLECLFKYLGVSYDIEALKNIEDMKHLLFFTTKCAYDIEPLHGHEAVLDETGQVLQSANYFFNKQISSYSSISADDRAELFKGINTWLDSRGCGGTLTIEDIEPIELNEATLVDGAGKVEHFKVGEGYCDSLTVHPTLKSIWVKANIVKMVANSDNFPQMSVSSLLSSLENQFGIKFSYDYEQKKVTAYLIRDVFRKQAAIPHPFHAKILSMLKVTEKITGVRIGYSAESDAKEQRNNIRYGVRDYDTNYDYISYPHPVTGGARATIYNKRYIDFFRTDATAGNYHVYIDLYTGNAYRVKVNSEATTVNDMKPAFFEVGGYKGVEEGDCSSINDDFIIEMLSDLEPIIFNDVNYQRERNFYAENDTSTTEAGQQHTWEKINASEQDSLLCAYVDEDMEHEFIEQRIRQNLASAYVNIYFTEKLKLIESYNPEKTDDGNSPLQHYDWGNAIALMRGGGSDAHITQYDGNYDGFGNNKWSMTNGRYALTSDTMDQFGVPYDYNGDVDGLGSGERFSLKPRAYKQPSWADAPLCIADPAVRNRGYVDTFLKELIYFYLNRKKFRVHCLTTVAQIAEIPHHWHDWWLINGKKCLINKVNTDISVKNGMGEVELEVYSI